MNQTIEYSIKNNEIPIIILDGQKLGVVTCNYIWMTRQEFQPTYCVLIATCTDISGNKYTITIDESKNEINITACYLDSHD
ncbi:MULTISPECIES: hypothetical protein [unclassified Enterococcus]|uniref:hypothetical protein n=1 Tax=unclassified Enterococcus TaxID=2608891 RepID=UPI001553FCEC|nr:MULTISPECIES: hypothetical protein [unclassified Enterococcus]MBS7578443.1 hypothetical protein [Enterococcus sp. MMGLQ5-2]MBS7585692.1 hypothetical protein [Enterococcus sp. MMGLQ5-1]NPD13551.1 hypothetical protein [Enterococcus sp. MMGLQ5-1]NPD38275.1 hypothetical protein [Enterococcus sp. MMGLQ5-2]